jgi:hypothetical protein
MTQGSATELSSLRSYTDARRAAERHPETEYDLPLRRHGPANLVEALTPP